MSDVVEALRRGEPVVLPTDTVYGLCCDASTREPTERLYALKRRELTQPSALLAASVRRPASWSPLVNVVTGSRSFHCATSAFDLYSSASYMEWARKR